MGQNPAVNIPIPTKIKPKMNGAPSTHLDPIGFGPPPDLRGVAYLGDSFQGGPPLPQKREEASVSFWFPLNKLPKKGVPTPKKRHARCKTLRGEPSASPRTRSPSRSAASTVRNRRRLSRKQRPHPRIWGGMRRGVPGCRGWLVQFGHPTNPPCFCLVSNPGC